MFVVVVTPNKDGKIELTKDELQKMLDDAYNKGYSDALWKPYTITCQSTNYGDKHWLDQKWNITCSSAVAVDDGLDFVVDGNILSRHEGMATYKTT